MKYVILKTENFETDVKRYNLIKATNKIIDDIRKKKNLQGWDKFSPPIYKKNKGNFRIIVYEKIFDKYPNFHFICFCKVLLKGSDKYKKFNNNPNGFIEKYIPDDEKFLTAMQNDVDVITIPQISPNEDKYLFLPNNYSVNKEYTVYESFYWKDNLKVDFLSEYEKLINALAATPEKYSEGKSINSQSHDIKISYRIFEEIKAIFLISIHTKKSNSIKELLEEDEKIKNIYYADSIKTEELLRNTSKAYPDLVLADDDLWMSIEKDSEGNIALSPEETKIKDSILKFDDGNKLLFPLFINGRAGSGKSTILYHIFSYILLNHINLDLNERLDYPPIFITYSERLLDTSKRNVRKLLENNHEIVIGRNKEKEKIIKEYVNNEKYEDSFKQFRELLIEQLNNYEKSLFLPTNFIGYSEFNNLWTEYKEKNPDKFLRSLSSETAWYVIRTYIKGKSFSLEDDFTPADYEELPESHKTIPLHYYKDIYEKVWIRWYKKYLSENNKWDDQDLCRYILDNKSDEISKYPAIFCDEAQDFTSIELELISNLLLFSKRDVKSYQIKNIPIAFAGDPFQTLNPSGFSWDAVKANYYNLINEFDKNTIGKSKTEINYHELSFNYRSAKRIVDFSNLIQLIRGIAFEIKNLQPQVSYFETDSKIYPTLQIDDYQLAIQAITEREKSKYIILPCDEEEEDYFIKNYYPEIKEFAFENNRRSPNIWGSISEKGNEYNIVILYKFGDYLKHYLDINLYNMLENLINDKNFKSSIWLNVKMKLEYFLNKLYVAATRAKKRLIIIDSKTGNNVLWKIFKDVEFLDTLKTKYSLDTNNDKWYLDNFYFSNDFHVENENELKENPAILAAQHEKDGRQSKSPEKMRAASYYYKLAKNYKKEKLCEAKAYEYEESYVKAAEKYLDIDNYVDDALRCYWLSKKSNKYQLNVDIYKAKLRNSETNIYYELSKFMLSNDEKKKEGSILILNLLSEKSDDFFTIEAINYNKEFLQDFIYSLLEKAKETSYKVAWNTQLGQLEKLILAGLNIEKDENYIKLLLELHEFEKCAKALEKFNKTDTNYYYMAKKEIEKYPQKLIFLDKLKFDTRIYPDEIIEAYKENIDNTDYSNAEYSRIILQAILFKKDQELLREFIRRNTSIIQKVSKEQLIRIIDLVGEENDLNKYIFIFEKEDLSLNEIQNLKLTNPNSKKFVIAWHLFTLFNNGEFRSIRKLMKSPLSYFDSKVYNETFYNVLLSVVFNLLARSNPEEIDNVISKFRNDVREFLQKNKNYYNNLDFKIQGALIEKFDTFNNALPFYERIIMDINSSRKAREYAKERWLKVKQKKYDYDNNPHKVTDNKDREDEFLEEINKKLKRWNFELVKNIYEVLEINSFPELENEWEINWSSGIDASEVVEKNIEECEGKSFIVKYNKNKASIYLENKIDGSRIYFNYNQNYINSEDLEVSNIKIDNRKFYCEVNEWDAKIYLIRSNEEHFFIIKKDDYDCKISIHHTKMLTSNA